ncbi:MAG: contractile injection system tape measure protein [Bacteroidota bacterium]
MKHVIGKQVIQLQLSTDREAAKLQHRFSQLYWQDLVPAMGDLFDELTGSEEVVEIDRLEIDIGMLPNVDFQKEWILPLLKQAIEKWFQQNKVKTSGIQRKPIQKSIFEKWLFFLENGYLPWSLQNLPKDWTARILESLATHVQSIHDLSSLLKKNRHALKRLVLQHDSTFLQHVIETLTAQAQNGLAPFLESLPSRQAKENFWEFTLDKIVVKKNKWSSSTLVKKYQEQQSYPPPAKPASDQKEDQGATTDRIDKSGIFIQCAGIVMVHPFLQRFFNRIDLLDGAEFKDHEAASRAIHLLNYLATHTTEPPEYDLSLLKFLCGVPLNTPVKKYIQLSAEEMEEADALLQAVVHHWGALGKVSNTSLQQAFLQREGKLLHEQSGWKLQMDKQTMDILLGQLPWGISVIKLPWMMDYLKVDWA